MKTYRVWARMTTYCYIDIEAEDKDSAFEQAIDIDGGEFITADSLGDFVIESAEELKG